MNKKLIFIFFITVTINSFSITFLDPAINRVLIYVDKDGANNYAFVKGISDHSEKKTENFLSIGLVGSYLTPRLEDKSDSTSVIPLINGKYKNFYTYGGISNGYNFYDGDKLGLNITLDYRFSGYKGEDFDSHYRDLQDVDDPIMLGLGGSYQVGYVFLTGGINHNLNGSSDENTMSVGVLSGIPFRKFLLLGYLSYELMSNSYTNRYFGISSPKSSSIKSYGIDGFGSAIRFTTVLAYSLSQDVDLFSYYYAEFFSDNINKSPLVKGDSSSMIGLGATYTF